MTIQTHKTEVQTLQVKVDAIKHERNAKGWPITTLHLELPDGVDLDFLQRAHTKDKDSVQDTKFTLRIYHDGDRKTWDVTSRGSKTKDFKVVAVVEVYFNANYRFEQYFNTSRNAGNFDVELEVAIESPIEQLPLFPPKHDDGDDAATVTA